MSDKRANMRERTQRFRRRLRGEKKAVSPVVATLILILIAVAAAAALYLWLVGWQGSITKGIGNPTPQATLTIGGSTSVYPFDELAVTQFQQNQSDIVISNNQGGSGAGMIAVCSGAVDIGAASFPVDAPTLVSSYGCSASVLSTAVVTTVAYDAVDVILSTSNTHGLLSINYDTLALIYQDASYVAGGTPSLISHYENNVAIPTGIPTTGVLNWNQIPAAVGGAVISGVTENTTNATGVPITVGPFGHQVGNDIFVNTSGAGAPKTPCGFSICASGAVPIQTVARSDASGTTQSFEARLIDATNSHTFATASQLASPTTGFSGCGSSNLISDCGYVASITGNGNPGVISAVSANANSIGYASDGLARASGSGVNLVSFLGVGQTVQSTNNGGILPTTGSSGTIAYGIEGKTGGYLGWRPFDLVTLNAPTGEAQAFLTFVLDPANNIALASESQEVSVYSV
jgi:flagellin-like protein